MVFVETLQNDKKMDPMEMAIYGNWRASPRRLPAPPPRRAGPRGLLAWPTACGGNGRLVSLRPHADDTAQTRSPRFEMILEKQSSTLVPDAFIYLQARPEVCASRMARRARPEEKGVPDEFLAKLHKCGGFGSRGLAGLRVFFFPLRRRCAALL